MKEERGRKPKISVIVPVYNVEAYLEKCLDSIRAQTYPDFEAILVDDASTDRSGEICSRYAEQDARLQVIHLPVNGGLSAARNKGMEQAAGVFVSFLDSDDYIEPDLLKRLYQSISESGADISICGTYGINGGGVPASLYSREETVKCLARREPFLWTAWGKLYSLEQARRHPFEERAYCCEDLVFFYQMLQEAETISYWPEKLYHYVYREGSLIHRKIDEKRCTVLPVLNEICREAAERFPELLYGFQQIALDTNVRLAMQTVECGTEGGTRFAYLKRFQRNLRRQFSREAWRLCSSKKGRVAELILYISAEVFWGFAVCYKRVKQIKRWRSRKRLQKKNEVDRPNGQG